MPANSTPTILLGDMEAAGYRVVRVEAKTVIAGWTSGPIYRKGTPNIAGWASVWSDRERKERVFVVDLNTARRRSTRFTKRLRRVLREHRSKRESHHGLRSRDARALRWLGIALPGSTPQDDIDMIVHYDGQVDPEHAVAVGGPAGRPRPPSPGQRQAKSRPMQMAATH